MNVVPLEQLTRENFAALVAMKFRVVIDGQNSLELELSQVTEPRTTAGGAKGVVYENFSLLFTGPANRLLSQRIHTFESDALGRIELFIVPVGCDAAGAKYEATFNRPVKPA